MEIKEFNKTELKVYEEVLDNGLRIFIAPLKRNSISVSYLTNFGGKDLCFIPEGKTEMVKMPSGIAHFLEHKMFDYKKENVHEYFAKKGIYNNAFTSKNTTEYIFEGPSDFESNLDFLLDFVSSPSFTEAEVEKEKPIILEEARGSFDNPFRKMIDTVLKNIFYDNTYSSPVVGTYSDIESITKDDLMTCYNTFYKPSNMILVIAGNVDPEKTIRIVKDNFAKRQFVKPVEIKRKEFNEPDTVKKDYEEVSTPITNELFDLCYKININKQNVTYYEMIMYLAVLFDLNLGQYSTYSEEVLKNGDLLGPLGFCTTKVDNHLLFEIYGETKDSKKVIKQIREKLANKDIDENDFDMIKNIVLSSFVLIGETSINAVNTIRNQILQYGKVNYDTYDKIKNLNISDYRKFISNLDLSNYTVAVVKNNKKS